MNNIYVLTIKFLLIICSSVFLLGATPKESVKANSPIKIQADKSEYFGKERKNVFSGNVIVFNDEFTLTSDKINVFLNKKNDIDKIVCKGNVNFKTKDIISISKDAEVTQKPQIAILSGGVKVWQGENILEGEKVTIYYNENRIIVDKGSKKRVTIIFNPENKENPFESKGK